MKNDIEPRRSTNNTGTAQHSFHIILAITTFAAGVLRAQSDDNDTDSEIFNLSPFTVDVSEDDRYLSTNSTSGTSLNTPIKDLPMSIEVVNAEFMEDIGATDFQEAMAYSSGVFLQEFTAASGLAQGGNNTGVNEQGSNETSTSSQGGVGGRFTNGAIIRGFNVAFQNRDGFRVGGLIAQHGIALGGIIDTSNVERLEVVRGPNSLLYGIGVLSGIVNMIPKRPLSAPVQKATVGFGSEGYLRTTLDVTGPLSKDFFGGQLDYRFAIALEERDHWTDWRGKELEYYVGQLQWQTDKIVLLLEGQYADRRDTGIGDQHVHDSLWALRQGQNLLGANDADFRTDFGEQVNFTKDYGGLPETHRITGPDTYHYRREDNFLANLDITPFENFTISAGMFLTNAREEQFDANISTVTNEQRSFSLGVLNQRPNDPNTENPQEILDFFDTMVTHYPNEHLELLRIPGDARDLGDYRVVRYWWDKDPRNIKSEQYRIRMAYSFEAEFLGRNSRHTFLVGRQDIKDEVDFTRLDSRISRQYADHLELAEDDPLIFRNINDHSVIRYQGEALGTPGWEYRNAEVWFAGHYALYQGQLLDDKLGIILGARHDRYHARDQQYDRFDEIAAFGPDYAGVPLAEPPADRVSDNPDNQTLGFFPPIEGISEYIPNPDEAEKTTTKTLALNYKLRDDLTIYGLRAEGLTPNTGARDGNLEGIPSEIGTSHELGIKFDLLDGKLSGTVSAYRIKRENALWSLAAAPAPPRWYGGVVHPTGEGTFDSGFDPNAVANSGVPISYGMATWYFHDEGVDLGKLDKIVYNEQGQPIGRVKEFPDGLLRSWEYRETTPG